MRLDPAVSVCMPAYNVEPYIAAAVESILHQTFRDFELIIIDDGSTDNTYPILKQFADRDDRIRLISRPNKGVARTANEALALSRGEFFARMDGDDLASPDRLARQVAYLRAHPDCAAVGAMVLLIDESGLPLYEMPDVQRGHDRIDAALLGAGWPIVQGASTFRRSAVLAVGGYREDLPVHEDHDLFLRLAERWKLDNLPEVLIQYRQRLGSLTFNMGSSGRQVLGRILSDARRRRNLPETPDWPASEEGRDAAFRNSILQRCRHWSWMSLKARHVFTARKYAWQAFRRDPLSSESWRLMACTLRGW